MLSFGRGRHGAQTIHYHLSAELELVPSLSTIWRVLRRRGFVTPLPHKRPRSSWIRFEAQLPNECWQSDVTHWKLADASDVEIMNMIDDHSRLAVASRAFVFAKANDVVELLLEAGARLGLPASLLTDNGRGTVTLRYRTRLHHIGVGRDHVGKRVLFLVDGLDVRILTEQGEVLRRLTLDPTKDYQGTGCPPGLPKAATRAGGPERLRCPDTSHLRARITRTLDSTDPGQAMTTADPEDVYAVVRTWVE